MNRFTKDQAASACAAQGLSVSGWQQPAPDVAWAAVEPPPQLTIAIDRAAALCSSLDRQTETLAVYNDSRLGPGSELGNDSNPRPEPEPGMIWLLLDLLDLASERATKLEAEIARLKRL